MTRPNPRPKIIDPTKFSWIDELTDSTTEAQFLEVLGAHQQKMRSDRIKLSSWVSPALQHAVSHNWIEAAQSFLTLSETHYKATWIRSVGYIHTPEMLDVFLHQYPERGFLCKSIINQPLHIFQSYVEYFSKKHPIDIDFKREWVSLVFDLVDYNMIDKYVSIMDMVNERHHEAYLRWACCKDFRNFIDLLYTPERAQAARLIEQNNVATTSGNGWGYLDGLDMKHAIGDAGISVPRTHKL